MTEAKYEVVVRNFSHRDALLDDKELHADGSGVEEVKAPRLNEGYSLLVVHSIMQGKNLDGTYSQRDCRSMAAVFVGDEFEKDVAVVKRAFIEDAVEGKFQAEANSGIGGGRREWRECGESPHW